MIRNTHTPKELSMEKYAWLAFVALFLIAIFTPLIAKVMNGAWRAIRRGLGWHKKIALEPDVFLANIQFYQPETITINKFDSEASEANAYRMYFDTIINRMPVRFTLTFPAFLVPSSATQIAMLFPFTNGHNDPDWDRLSSTKKALVRLLLNEHLTEYCSPLISTDSYYEGFVRDPAAVAVSPPVGPRVRTPCATQTVV